MSQPLVSVVTPTRNRRPLLAETLDSVADQTLTAWEHIVVDDGSEDGTAEMMAARTAADPRVRYIERQGECSGANVCRNIGLRAATAPYVVLLDSDDLLDPDCLRRRVEVLDRNADLDFATFEMDVFVKKRGDLDHPISRQHLGDDLTRFLYFEIPWITASPIWRRETLFRIGLLEESLLSWQDVELHVRAIAAGCRYLRFAEIDHHMRWQWEETKVSIEQHRSPTHLHGAMEVFERMERHVRAGPGMDWVRQRALCSLYFLVAEMWVKRGDLGPALSTWATIRRRRLGPPGLYLMGALLLVLTRFGAPAETVVRKWRGWSRLRTLPEIVAP